jgi:hypothetical protein
LGNHVEHFHVNFWPFVLFHLKSAGHCCIYWLVCLLFCSLILGSLYILGRNHLPDKYLGKIFSHSMGCFLILMIVKLLIWFNANCESLFLLPEILEPYSESPCSCLYLEVFSINFPVVVSGLILKLLIHFELIFVQGERQRPSEVRQHILLVLACLCCCFRSLTSSTPSLKDMKKNKRQDTKTRHWKITIYHALGAESPGGLCFFY